MRPKYEVPFRPRRWQRPLIADPKPRIVAVVHRRAGKSTGLMWRGIRRCLTEKKPKPRVVHILPYGVMWKRTGLWDALASAARAIPGAQIWKSEMNVQFANGSTYQCGGADNQDSWRGGYADECIVDEYDDCPPSMVPLVIEPMLADRDGVLVRSGTPKGRGVLQKAYDRAQVSPEYSSYLLDYTKTNALSQRAIDRLRQEMTEEEFAQELECSFEAPNSGSYYGKLMAAAQAAGRITQVDYDPELPVWTSWDLGVADLTSVWFGQTTYSGEWRFIDYLEGSGVGLQHYTDQLKAKPYRQYAMHLLPHDAAVKELGSGLSRTETFSNLGLHPWRVLRQANVADGINAVRMILPRAWFDAEKCARGIDALRHYRREWHEAAQTWRATPVHDWASHACLTGDSRVLTDGGERRIDQVCVGDRVWTPAGFADVTAAGPVGFVNELLVVTLVDGRVLRCTPEHKIATARGFVQADALRYTDIVLSGNEWTSRLIGSLSKARSTGYRATITAAMSGDRQGRPVSIGRFGRALTAPFQRVARFITETAIPSIMPWRTSIASMPQSIGGSTAYNVMLRANLSPQVSLPYSGPPNGMPAPMASSGTGETAVRSGTTGNGLQSLVSSAVRLLLRLSPSGRSGVTSIARWRTSTSGEATPLVYDLTVKNHACYQANGFLVSNSDSMRYMALGVREIGPPKPPERQPDSWERAWQNASRGQEPAGWRVA